MPRRAVVNWGFARALTEKMTREPGRWWRNRTMADQFGSDHAGPDCQIRVAAGTVAAPRNRVSGEDAADAR
jgi:hypothetical protein